MPILIVFSGFLAIVVVGSILVALNDALEAVVGRRVQARGGAMAPGVARSLGGRGRSRHRSLRRTPGRRAVPRDVVVVHATRVRSADA